MRDGDERDTFHSHLEWLNDRRKKRNSAELPYTIWAHRPITDLDIPDEKLTPADGVRSDDDQDSVDDGTFKHSIRMRDAIHTDQDLDTRERPGSSVERGEVKTRRRSTSLPRRHSHSSIEDASDVSRNRGRPKKDGARRHVESDADRRKHRRDQRATQDSDSSEISDIDLDLIVKAKGERPVKIREPQKRMRTPETDRLMRGDHVTNDKDEVALLNARLREQKLK